MNQILLIEDDLSFSHLIQKFLEKNGFRVEPVFSLKEAKQRLRNSRFDLVLLDFYLPDGNAFDLLSVSQHAADKPVTVIMTSFNDVRTAVRAIHLGASNYITKPLNHEELLMVIRHALDKKQESPAAATLPQRYVKGSGKTAEDLFRSIELVAPTDMTVIIRGESGTGKEGLARLIHEKSKRSSSPFVAIDCGALSDELASSELFGHEKGAFTGAVTARKGQMEAAQGGTLFLDEVGNLSYQVQVKLLRAIQEREIQPLGSVAKTRVDLRLITATNDDLGSSVKEGRFREDLYHRLNEFSVHIPALRERLHDLPEFVDYFIVRANSELDKNVKKASKSVIEIFMQYSWPGNLRELRNIVKRAVLLCDSSEIQPGHLPPELVQTTPVKNPVPSTDLRAMNELNEKELIVKTLNDVKFNKSKAAALLNIDRKTLYTKMARYGIEG